jgi:hypothetical protein
LNKVTLSSASSLLSPSPVFPSSSAFMLTHNIHPFWW